eukprot:1144907-Pleurochrysis_carterae.AAC.1
MPTPVQRLQKSPPRRVTLWWTAQTPPTLLMKPPTESPAQPLTPPTRRHPLLPRRPTLPTRRSTSSSMER